MTPCLACGTDNRHGRRFCARCGAALETRCQTCGAANQPDDRFCGQCGSVLLTGPPVDPDPESATSSLHSVSELRLVSVLFADLVGFTAFSEDRDPEAVRDLLSRYFDRCRALIERYGGTLEKFIGDAVMAVWGSPVAREDDAERAVRAALDLIQAVAGLGEEVGMPGLVARAGVLTGNAAVEVGAESEGMVLGDTVNTASRLQSIAAPGTVLVDAVTRRASEASIAYEDAGSQELRGRAQPVRTWTALRVVAGVGGARRRSGPEPPLVGRDRERQTIIGAFEAVLAGDGARLVSVIGEAGLGKSRLTWELEKHADGVSDTVLWHRGRSLSYGDGVAFWALAEMIRARAGIAEEEEPQSARTKLEEVVARYVADADERRLVEPRLAALIGLERRAGADQADLFSGWRLFIERMSETAPVILAFEDMQWADAGLLEFIFYLLEWSAPRQILIIALARPEPNHPLGQGPDRARTETVRLAPLPDAEMDALLCALVPGAPEDLRRRIAARAEGVPLFATEIVRMMVDRGVLVARSDGYELAGPLIDVEIPETLQALIAARLDGLPTAYRRLLQAASVLGLRFSRAGLIAVSDRADSEVRAGLGALIDRQLVALDSDPRSAQHGQYGFVQALVRRVSYGTLGRRERKQLHLRAAEHVHSAWGGEADEVADVRAAHLLDAVRAAPDAPDAPAITGEARRTLVAAAERASGLAAGGRAADLFAQAAELAETEPERAGMLDRAMQAAIQAGDRERTTAFGEQAISLWTYAAQPRRAALCSARVGRFLAESSGRYSDEFTRIQDAYETLRASDERDADLAEITVMLAANASESGDYETAWRYNEEALEIAEELRLAEVISRGLNLKNLMLYARGRAEEARGLLLHSLRLSQEHDLPFGAIRAHNNLAALFMNRFANREALDHLEEARTLSVRLGSRRGEWLVEGIMPVVLFRLGRWDEALAVAERLTTDDVGDRFSAVEAAVGRALVLLARGEIDRAAQDLELLERETIEHEEYAGMKAAMGAALLRHRGDSRAALQLAAGWLAGNTRIELDVWIQEVRVQALEAMLELEELTLASEAVTDARAIAAHGDVPYLAAQADRFAARIAAALQGAPAAAPLFRRAVAALRELEDPFDLAIVLAEQAETLPGSGESRALLAEARMTFDRLDAKPWRQRAAAAGSRAIV